MVVFANVHEGRFFFDTTNKNKKGNDKDERKGIRILFKNSKLGF